MKTAVAIDQAADDSGRLAARFRALKAANKSALVTFITAGDPDLGTSAALLAGLPKAGADVIELSMPFSDPMADGPIIQEANLRAFRAGISVKKVLQMVREFRKTDDETPLILMGYFNPIYVYGSLTFLKDAKEAGVDGLIIVDLPPEEDNELCLPARAVGLNFIRLVTPTTDAKRLPTVLKNASGFLYYVSVAGITGTKAASLADVEQALKEVRVHSDLPIAVGFGITTPEQAQRMAAHADGVIVGSAIVKSIADQLDDKGNAKPDLVGNVLNFVTTLAKATHTR